MAGLGCQIRNIKILYDCGMKKTLAFLAISLGTTICGLAETPRPLAVSPNAVLEAIEFEDVAPARQKAVLTSLGLRVGDRFDAEAKQNVGAALRAVQQADQPLTFTYTPGSKNGTAKLIIRAGC